MIAKEWIAACKLPENKASIPLDRVEGGLRSVTNDIQLRFWESGKTKLCVKIMDYEEGSWSTERLLDLCKSFAEVANRKLVVELPTGEFKVVRAELIYTIY